MITIRIAVDIQSSVEQVWDMLSDLSSHADWMAEAESIEFLGSRTEGVGTVMRVLTRVGPLQTADILEVTEWTPPTTISVAHRGLVSGSGEFLLAPLQEGTRFTWSETLSLPWRLGGPIGELVARPILEAIWRRNLERFRDRF